MPILRKFSFPLVSSTMAGNAITVLFGSTTRRHDYILNSQFEVELSNSAKSAEIGYTYTYTYTYEKVDQTGKQSCLFHCTYPSVH